MRFILSSTSLGLMITSLVFSVGCSSSSKVQSTGQADVPTGATSAKPIVKESPATVTVHAKDLKAVKAAKAPKISKSEGGAGVLSIAECSAARDERKLEIKSTESGGCEVLYTKSGKTNAITIAQRETQKCHETFDNVKGNLEKAGFKCN